jgi:hypothetical protein
MTLLATIGLAGCAQVQVQRPTQPASSETVAPSETAAASEPATATSSVIPQSAFTAAPLLTETPEVFEAPKEATMTLPPASSIPTDPTISGWINQAVQDLAARLKIGEDAIQVIAFESVVWPDGGLGCPEPGVFYTQVLVEGFRIRLQHNGQTYDYHGSMKRAPFLCEAK